MRANYSNPSATLPRPPRTDLVHMHRSASVRAVSFAEARSWFSLAVGSLIIAGLLSLAVVVGRIPVINRSIDDPLFFKRCLVVHVVLALVVWFYSFIAALLTLRLPGHNTGLRQMAFHASALGVLAMLMGAVMRGAQPILANYVPVVHHPFFLAGLALFFGGIVVLFLSLLTMPQPLRGPTLHGAAGVGLITAAVAVVLAAVTWLAAVTGMPAGVQAATYFEFTAWGPGHVLQVANAAAMLAVWLWVLERATGKPVLSPKSARWLFTALLAPHFLMPLLTVRGTLDTLYHSGATQLMRWGIFPVVAIVLVACIRHVWRHRRTAGEIARQALLTGFVASASLTTLGFVLGACIRSSTTLVPAHYHASLGAVTVAFMTAAYLVVSYLRPSSGGTAAPWKQGRWQLVLFGVGQTIFVVGFAVGGAYGLGRKAYAAEQHVRTTGEYAGLFIMGAGGLIAVAGGLWFLGLMVREVRSWWAHRSATPRAAAALFSQ